MRNFQWRSLPFRTICCILAVVILRFSNRTNFDRILGLSLGNILDLDFLLEITKHVFSFDFLRFLRGVLLNEFIHADEPTANSHVDLPTLFALQVDPSTPELVHALGFSKEHYFKLFFLRVHGQVFGKVFVQVVILSRNVGVVSQLIYLDQQPVDPVLHGTEAFVEARLQLGMFIFSKLQLVEQLIRLRISGKQIFFQ